MAIDLASMHWSKDEHFMKTWLQNFKLPTETCAYQILNILGLLTSNFLKICMHWIWYSLKVLSAIMNLSLTEDQEFNTQHNMLSR